MSHCLPPQPDCATAWLHAAKLVDEQKGHQAHNVLIDIVDPILETEIDNPVVSIVNEFLCHSQNPKPVISIANTIFPNSLYRHHGAPDFIEMFRDRVLPKIRKSNRWSGYYFERMIAYPTTKGGHINQIWSIVERIRDQSNKSLNKFELSLYDPECDIDNSPYGGQCLSFLSFKILPGDVRKLTLTAMYRNHYYIGKLLGNLIGLGWLMNFVAIESQIEVGPLTVLSTHAEIDQPKGYNRQDIDDLLAKCSKL